MDMTRHIVTLGPAAVELVDRTMLDLARGIAVFQATIARYVKGNPGALLLVEFAGDDMPPLMESLIVWNRCWRIMAIRIPSCAPLTPSLKPN